MAKTTLKLVYPASWAGLFEDLPRFNVVSVVSQLGSRRQEYKICETRDRTPYHSPGKPRAYNHYTTAAPISSL